MQITHHPRAPLTGVAAHFNDGQLPRVVIFGWLGALVSIALAAVLAAIVIAATQPRKPAASHAAAPQHQPTKVAR